MIPFGSAQNGVRELIDLAFSKKKADDRKDWLRQFRVRLLFYPPMPRAFELLIACAAWHLPQSRRGRDFIFRIHQQGTDPVFMADNIRSIPQWRTASNLVREKLFRRASNEG